MNIKLTGDYYMRSDSMNIMIIKSVNGRDNIQGYYTTIEEALKSFIELKIRGSSATSVNTLLMEIKRFERSLNIALTPLKLKVVEEKA